MLSIYTNKKISSSKTFGLYKKINTFATLQYLTLMKKKIKKKNVK